MLDLNGVKKVREVTVFKLNVDNGTYDLYDFSDIFHLRKIILSDINGSRQSKLWNSDRKSDICEQISDKKFADCCNDIVEARSSYKNKLVLSRKGTGDLEQKFSFFKAGIVQGYDES